MDQDAMFREKYGLRPKRVTGPRAMQRHDWWSLAGLLALANINRVCAVVAFAILMALALVAWWMDHEEGDDE